MFFLLLLFLDKYTLQGRGRGKIMYHNWFTKSYYLRMDIFCNLEEKKNIEEEKSLIINFSV